jgi:hypothetical protein
VQGDRSYSPAIAYPALVEATLAAMGYGDQATYALDLTAIAYSSSRTPHPLLVILEIVDTAVVAPDAFKVRVHRSYLSFLDTLYDSHFGG